MSQLGDGEKLRRDNDLLSSAPAFLTIPGEAVPKGRPRFNRKTGTLYTPKETKVYEDCVALVAKASRASYTKDIALAVQIVIYTAKKSVGDADNIAKSVLDGLQKGGAIEDDSQVWLLVIKRIRSKNPRVDVHIRPAVVESEGE